MRKIKNLLFPDVEKLAEKDSSISTKRYAHLRIINHFVWQSWISLFALIKFGKFDYLNFHLGIIGAFAFANGALALEIFKNFTQKKDDKSS